MCIYCYVPVFRLTVTDSDGVTNGSLVGLKVVPEPDYPPHANAGSDVILKMPNSEVVLNGTRTSDDKPGLKYLWKMLSEQSGIDMEVHVLYKSSPRKLRTF